jgi:putative hemolysin
MSSTLIEISIILLLILANGVFSMSEIALISARKARLQQALEDGQKQARIALELMETPNRFLSTVQIGISLVGVFAGAVGGATLAEKLSVILQRIPALAPYAYGISLTLVVLAITYFSLVIGELIPKRVALNDPEGVAQATAGPMRMISKIAAPVVSILSASTELGIRLLGIRASNEPPVTENEIKVMIEEGTRVGVFEEVEQDMVESVFRLSDRRVDSIMTQRTEIIWIDLDDPYKENLQVIVDGPHSQLPVGRGSLDNVIGMLYARDLLRSIVRKKEPVDLSLMVKPALFVSDSTPAFKVLENLRNVQHHVALVVDEYGGLQGLVTLFDVLEAIVGDISRQGGPSEPRVVRREDGSLLMDGLMPVYELKEILGVDKLPGEDRIGFQTLGGFVMSQIGNIPTAGQSFEWDDWRFEVLDMDGRRVDKILVAPLSDSRA